MRKARNMTHVPNPKIPDPIIGMIQWILACADQPYQLRILRQHTLCRTTIHQHSQNPNRHKKRPHDEHRDAVLRLALPIVMFLREVVVGSVPKFRAEERRDEKADAEPDVDEAVDADAEAVGRGEEACANVSKDLRPTDGNSYQGKSRTSSSRCRTCCNVLVSTNPTS